MAGAPLEREGLPVAGPARPPRVGPLVGGIVAAVLTFTASWGGAVDAARPASGRDVFRSDLAAVVEHYDGALALKLSPQQKKDLIEYLKSI